MLGWAQGNTTTRFMQMHYSRGVILARSENVSAKKTNSIHRTLPQNPRSFIAERWTMFINTTFMETHMYFMRHQVSQRLYAEVVFQPKGSKVYVPHVPQNNLHIQLPRWVVLFYCKHLSNKVRWVRTILLTHLMHYSIFLFYTFRSKRDIWQSII